MYRGPQCQGQTWCVPREMWILTWSPRLMSTASVRHQPDTLKVIWPRRLPVAWLVLPVLPCFGRPNQRQTFGTWKCFSSPSLLCNLIPRQNQLSSPGIAEYLAYSSIWNACAWKNFSGPKKCFSCPRLLCNLILRQNELAKPSPFEPLRTNPLRTWGCPRS